MKSNKHVWIEPQNVTISPIFTNTVGGSPLCAEMMMRRGIISVDDASSFLNPNQYLPVPSCELPDLDKAVDRIQHAISRRERIIIWGDFDVDGQTSTTLLFTCLKRLGAKLTYHIPIRGRESHGISLAVLEEILSSEFRLLITCDTGISAHDAVEFAKEKGVDTIITDHHALPDVLPQAVAVVSSQRLAPGHPLNALCGVGVVYKLVEELYRQNGIIPELKSEMDLVALGTIADIAFLSTENRYLVQRGLEQIQTCPRPALQAMLKLSKINHEHFTEEHISYFLAPRLNALGRFDDANAIIDFFLSKDLAQAEDLAAKLERLNAHRKLESDLIFKSAQDQIEHDRTLLDSPLLVLSHPAWPAPVIGVVASRLSEIYSLPVILFSTPAGTPARGSARSVEGINIIEMISSQKDKLISFGGHPMAAGLSIESDRIDDFRRGIGREISNSTQLRPTCQQIQIDSYISLGELSLDLVADLDRLAPFGPGNPSITLAARDLILVSHQPVGKNENHLILIVEGPGGDRHQVIWWQGDRSQLPEGRFDMAYSVRANNFRGQNRVQIEWVSTRMIEDTIKVANPCSSMEVIDYRQASQPQTKLQEILVNSPLVFSEGENPPQAVVFDRYHIQPRSALVIWSLPCGREELLQIIRLSYPDKIYLFANDPGSRELPAFLSRLGGLLRFAINQRQGWVDLNSLIKATAQKEITVLTGIDCYISHGDICQKTKDGNQLQFARPGLANTHHHEIVMNDLTQLMTETEAYRSFYLRADPYHVIS